MDKISRTAMGGTSSHAYHCNGTRNRVPRATRSRKPPAPLTMRVNRIPELTGPSSIAGNIRMPFSVGSGSSRRSFGAASKNAAVQETAKVGTK